MRTPSPPKSGWNLLTLMLDSFKSAGHCVTMDSAYMGNIMAMIGQDVWRINMVGTAQANRTGAIVDCTKSMKKGTYGAVCWQHTWRSLCFAVWLDNALVRTLSNFHGPVMLKAGRGVLRKKRDSDEKQERTKTEVSCPAQTRDYCKTFHLIGKGNGAEANYDLRGEEPSTQLVAKVDLLALQHVTQQRLQNVQGAW
jgi:hypothetical protein